MTDNNLTDKKESLLEKTIKMMREIADVSSRADNPEGRTTASSPKSQPKDKNEK